MKQMVQVDGAGRLVLPKQLRDRFRLEGGDMLSLAVKGEAIELRPAKTRKILKTINGVLVVGSNGETLKAKDFVGEEREERIAELIRRTHKNS